jgi:uncharacterized protein YeaO (DUF488 family)
MARPECSHAIALLAVLPHQANFALGCYCEDERQYHRSVLAELLRGHGALGF